MRYVVLSVASMAVRYFSTLSRKRHDSGGGGGFCVFKCFFVFWWFYWWGFFFCRLSEKGRFLGGGGVNVFEMCSDFLHNFYLKIF